MLLLARQRGGVNFLSQKMPSNWIRSIGTAHNCKFFIDCTSSNTAHCAVKANWGNFSCPWSSLPVHGLTRQKLIFFCKVIVYWGTAVKGSYLWQIVPQWNGLHWSWTHNGIMIKCLQDFILQWNVLPGTSSTHSGIKTCRERGRTTTNSQNSIDSGSNLQTSVYESLVTNL